MTQARVRAPIAQILYLDAKTNTSWDAGPSPPTASLSLSFRVCTSECASLAHGLGDWRSRRWNRVEGPVGILAACIAIVSG
jgi:hypothetical protein